MQKDAKGSRVSDDVRRFVEQNYVRPARRRGDSRFKVTVGDVHRSLRLLNRVPLVCSALRREGFLRENHVRIVEQTGPPSGLSTTVQITYEFTDLPSGASSPSKQDPLLALRGLLKDVFRELGGGEKFIREEREAWNESSTEEQRN